MIVQFKNKENLQACFDFCYMGSCYAFYEFWKRKKHVILGGRQYVLIEAKILSRINIPD